MAHLVELGKDVTSSAGSSVPELEDIGDFGSPGTSFRLERTEVARGRERLGLFAHALKRTLQLAMLSLFFLPQLLLGGRYGPVVLRRYLQTCGGAFIKLGQVLSMR